MKAQRLISWLKTFTEDAEARAASTAMLRLACLSKPPLCGRFSAMAKEIFDMLSTVRDNDEDVRDLLAELQEYGTRLDDLFDTFVSHNTETSERPVEHRTKLYMKAVTTFERMKNAIHESLTVTDLGEHLPRFLANPVVRRNIKDCTRQLRRAREGLLADTLNVVMASIPQKQDEYQFAIAKPLDHRRLDITEKVRPMSSRPHPNASPSFWSDTFKAHVDGEIKVVKLYYKSSGGRSTFKEHLEVLSRNPSTFSPKIYGYNWRTDPSYIVFDFASAVPLVKYVLEIWEREPQIGMVTAYKFMHQLRASQSNIISFLIISERTTLQDVIQFFYENGINLMEPDLRGALRNAVVTEKGQVVVAPVAFCQQCIPITYWDVSFSDIVSVCWAEPLKDITVRPLRRLGYALESNLAAVMDIEIDLTSSDGLCRLNDPLEKWWPTRYERYAKVPYPYRIVGNVVQAGDYGVWCVRPGFPPVFTTLGNLRQEIAMPLVLTPACNNERCGDNIYRKRVERVDEEDDGVKKYRGECVWWFWLIGDGRHECDYFFDNAARLAKMHGVQPHELALIIRSFRKLEFPEIHVPLNSPSGDLYFFTHLSKDDDVVAAYWSFGGAPSEGATWDSCPELQTLNGADYAVYRHVPDVYIQFEEADFCDVTPPMME